MGDFTTSFVVDRDPKQVSKGTFMTTHVEFLGDDMTTPIADKTVLVPGTIRGIGQALVE